MGVQIDSLSSLNYWNLPFQESNSMEYLKIVVKVCGKGSYWAFSVSKIFWAKYMFSQTVPLMLLKRIENRHFLGFSASFLNIVS